MRKVQKPIAVGMWHELVDFFHLGCSSSTLLCGGLPTRLLHTAHQPTTNGICQRFAKPSLLRYIQYHHTFSKKIEDFDRSQSRH